MIQKIPQKIKRLLLGTLFLIICFHFLSRITYIFREVSCSRDNITGFEREGDLDVVCIGASTMVEYYQPLTAWREYGYTSYVYGTLYGQIDLFGRYIDRVLRTHEPELFVVDLRMLVTLSEEGIYEQGLRFWTDSLPLLSPDRYLSLRDYFENHIIDESVDKTSYYFDIAKYHTNILALQTPENWHYADNKGESESKGYELSADHHFFEQPTINTSEKTSLSDIQTKVLYQLLDHCREKNLEVLFVVCPYIVEEEDQKIYNTAKDIVVSYGYDFINANEYYDEMELDFSTDMKNVNHVNCVGAEKYTRFLAEYITKTYVIPMHVNDASYGQWDEAAGYFAEALDEGKKEVYQAVEDKRDAIRLSSDLRLCENFYEWITGAQNPNYTVIVSANLQKFDMEKADMESKQLLGNWDIKIEDDNNCLYISRGNEVIYSAKDSEPIEYSGWLGVVDGLGQKACNVQIDGDISVAVDDREYAVANDAVNLLLFDNNLKEVIDNVIIYIDMDGSIRMERPNAQIER